jgi:protein TonB
MLIAKVVSLPQPPYPPLARQIKVSGTVNVQILVDESGRVVTAHAVSGHPFLTKSAEEAAQRARFTPTVLNGQPVKVQGLITYNYVLQ